MRLIDADALARRTIKEKRFVFSMHDMLRDEMVFKTVYKDLGEFIASAPTIDAVPVVRCKDCKHNVANMETDPWDDTDYEDIVCLHWMSDGCGPNDFCSRGERRNDADLHLPG